MKVKHVSNSWLARDGLRLDCGPYMSGAVEARDALARCRTERLGSLTRGPYGGIFRPPIFGMHFAQNTVESADHGVPFLTGSSMLDADLSALPLVSRKLATSPKYAVLRIAHGMTLVSCSGTVGKVVYARPQMDGMWSSQAVMKIVPDPERVLPGYLYAYLSSKFGVPLLTGGTYGAIVPQIEKEHLIELPVPRLGAGAEEEIHALIESAANNRSRAHQLRLDARASFTRQYSLSDLSEADTAVNRAIFSVRAGSLQRLDAAHYSPACRAAADELASSDDARRLDKVARVFTPGIFKRLHVDDPKFGYPYFAGTELFQYDAEPRGHLSRRAPNIKEYLVGPNWLLIQDAGQLEGLIGHILRVTPTVADSVVSNNLMRVVTEEALDAAYLFAVLSSPHGYRAITRNAFGSSIPHLDPAHIGAIRLPWPTSAIRKRIAEPVLEAWRLEDEASENARLALKKVEDAIEKGAN